MPDYVAAIGVDVAQGYIRHSARTDLELWTLDALRTDMARYGIDAAVLSVPTPLAADGGRPSEVARVMNEELARAVRADPGSFAAVAALPLPHVDAALAELQYALDTLELDGVLLLSHFDGLYLGDGVFEPIFAELDRRGTFVHVHPAAAPHPRLLPQFPLGTYEPAFETTRAIANLVYSGTLERYPNVKLQFGHLGGSMPHLAYRIAPHVDSSTTLAKRAPAGLFAYLKRLYYDTAQSNHLEMLAVTLKVTDLDHVVFGSDWPFHDLDLAEGATDPAPAFAALRAADRQRIDGLNAAALIPRFAAAVG
jgi:predicted TIM-barrel fold metal-dependent hydrolase